MKMLKRIVLSLIILLTIGYLVASWTLSAKVIFPESSLEKTKSRIVHYWGTTYADVLATFPESENFSLETKDELTLRGRYFQMSDSATCAIIMPHGWGAIWADMLKYAPAFSDCNCDFIVYDHRAHGESDGRYATGGIKEAEDLWLVTKWATTSKNFEFNQIGWMGSSWGAATAIIAGAENENVGFIIADSPYQDWYSAVFERAIRDYGSGIQLLASGVMEIVNLRSGVDYAEASPLLMASGVEEPVLLIHSKGDTKTSSKQSVNIAENLNQNNSQFHHSQWGNDHVMDVVKNQTEFRKIVKAFLLKEAPHFLKKEDQEVLSLTSQSLH